jgi:eukaryotic-like serine/threonine-protein kinase
VGWWSSKRPKQEPGLTGIGPPLLAGRYQMGHRLGHGGVSQVFEGVDMRTGSPVAIKLIPLPPEADAAERRDWLQRLHREAELSHRLRHPDIIAVHDSGIEGSHGWLVMERVNGVDLSRYTHRERLLPEALVLRIGVRVGAALAHAHAHGVVHRDLKPANVLVDLGGGGLKLADFGVAGTDHSQVTRTGLTLGTPAYMAPEVLGGDACSPASDAYALGVLLYELLSGRRPHVAESLGELLRSVTEHAATPLSDLRPDLPQPVVQKIHQLLAALPQDRPHDLLAWSAEMAGLATVLARILSPDVPLRL